METINITPTWSALAHTIAQLYCNGTSFESRKIAEEELSRMAKLADLYVESQKKNKN